MTLASHLDHLVVAAQTLDQGVQWCEAVLGAIPNPGGQHPLMGTHNRLLRIATTQYPRAYLEIIAIDPAARPPQQRRWFDLDDPILQQAIREQPRFIHFVASTIDAAAALQALRRLHIERGPLRAAQRPTPRGLLKWQIAVRDDGQRLFHGGLPTLIQWGQVHPADSMPEAGLSLQALRVSHPRSVDLRAAHAAIGLGGVEVEHGSPNLEARLATPRGLVTLESTGI